MKRYIYSAEQINKNFEFNKKQTQVGSKLKTYKGSVIQRSPKYGVGKEIGGDVYVHKNYMYEVVPHEIMRQCEIALDYYFPDFDYNCIRYSPKKQSVSFQESPDFDTAREPVVGDYITIFYNPDEDPRDFDVQQGHSNYIWHHKWNWVHDDYTGFDVAESWNWSKEWLNTLLEPSDGNGISRWNTQLDKYGLPHDE